MSTLYFNAAIDNDWNNLNNWWMDDNFTIQATNLPTSLDNVVVSAYLNSNSGGTTTVLNLTVNGSGTLFLDITVTGIATFNDTSSTYGCTITGNVTFNDYSYADGISIDGAVTFHDYAETRWYLSAGICRFYNNSRIHASMPTNANTVEFYDTSGLALGSIYCPNGNCVFYDSSYMEVNTTITGEATNTTFNDTSRCSGNDFSGNLTLNNAAYSNNESAVVTGNCTVTGTGYYIGSVNGNFTLSVAAAEYRIKNPAVTATITVGGVVTVTYEKGINGSSILGIV